MIRFLIIIPLALLFGVIVVFAQQDPQFSQYMSNTLAFNPGYAGSKDAICASALHRINWVGFPGAYATSMFTAHAPISPFKINSGVGVTILNDKIGYEKNLGFNVVYAYRIDIKNGEGKLGIGVSAGFLNKSMNVDKWEPPEGTPVTDPAIPNQKESAMTFDLGLGLYYRAEKLYLGLSSTNITQPKVKFEKGGPDLTRHYYITAGYNLSMPNPSFDLLPSVFIASDGSASSFDFNSIILYNKRIWGGVTYRLKAAIVGMVGLELKNGLRIGYSYDFATTKLSGYNSGTHEITLGYCFNIIREKIPHKYKSVRFL